MEIFENLKILNSELVITRFFPSGKSQVWNLEPYWTKAEILSQSKNNDALVVRSKEKVVMLGSFLNLNDKKKLMKKINNALSSYKVMKD